MLKAPQRTAACAFVTRGSPASGCHVLIVSSALLWGVQATPPAGSTPIQVCVQSALTFHGDYPHVGPSCSPQLLQLQAQALLVPWCQPEPPCPVHPSVYSPCSSVRPCGVGCGLKRGRHTDSPVIEDPRVLRARRRVWVMGGVEGGSQGPHTGEVGCGGLVLAVN